MEDLWKQSHDLSSSLLFLHVLDTVRLLFLIGFAVAESVTNECWPDDRDKRQCLLGAGP